MPNRSSNGLKELFKELGHALKVYFSMALKAFIILAVVIVAILAIWFAVEWVKQVPFGHLTSSEFSNYFPGMVQRVLFYLNSKGNAFLQRVNS